VVDSFNTSDFRELGLEVVHVLTHFHSDHRSGLSRNFRGRLICSPITADLLEGILGVKRTNIERLKNATKKVIEPPLDSGLQEYQITFIDANHCPGAVCVLIQGTGFCHFYMGDVRIDMNFLNHFSRLKIPHINTCWIDSTFCDKGSLWNAMPKKSESIKALHAFMEQNPCAYAFEFELLGTEELLESILAAYPTENILIVNSNRYRELEIIYADNQAVLSRLVTPIGGPSRKYRFHIISRRDNPLPGYVRVRATTQRWSINVRRNREDCPIIEFYNGTCFLFYSMHSSRREIEDFLEQVPRVDHVIPLVTAIEVAPLKPTETPAEHPGPPRSVRGARRPFKFSNDAIHLSDFADTQETLAPHLSGDEIQLPFWGDRMD